MVIKYGKGGPGSTWLDFSSKTDSHACYKTMAMRHATKTKATSVSLSFFHIKYGTDEFIDCFDDIVFIRWYCSYITLNFAQAESSPKSDFFPPSLLHLPPAFLAFRKLKLYSWRGSRRCKSRPWCYKLQLPLCRGRKSKESRWTCNSQWRRWLRQRHIDVRVMTLMASPFSCLSSRIWISEENPMSSGLKKAFH